MGVLSTGQWAHPRPGSTQGQPVGPSTMGVLITGQWLIHSRGQPGGQPVVLSVMGVLITGQRPVPSQGLPGGPAIRPLQDGGPNHGPVGPTQARVYPEANQ